MAQELAALKAEFQNFKQKSSTSALKNLVELQTEFDSFKKQAGTAAEERKEHYKREVCNLCFFVVVLCTE